MAAAESRPGRPGDAAFSDSQDVISPLRKRSGSCPEMAAYDRPEPAVGIDYEEEALRVFRQLNAEQETFAGGSCSGGRAYNDADTVWVHPETKAAVLIGNSHIASNRARLMESKITCIVNCLEKTAVNFHEGDSTISYLHFPITKWSSQPGIRTDAGLLDYFSPLFGWIDAKLDKGESVLIHCLAGAHRGGTAGTAFVMYKTGLGAEEAVLAVQKVRPFVEPIFNFKELLARLERALRAEEELGCLICP